MTVIYLGRPTGPRLRDLSRTQEDDLNAWLTAALIDPPRKGEPVPVEYTRALGALARRRGISFFFNGDEMRIRGEAILGRNIPGCVGGSKRKVRVTDPRGVVGQKVEPYHEMAWRDDTL